MSDPKPDPRPTPAERAIARVRAVRQARGRPLADGEKLAVRTGRGEVHFAQIDAHEDGGRSWVDVRLDGPTAGGDPHFKIVNPPTLVRDPLGDIEVNGERYRDDPIAALAEVIASLGGARSERGRRRRRRTR